MVVSYRTEIFKIIKSFETLKWLKIYSIKDRRAIEKAFVSDLFF